MRSIILFMFLAASIFGYSQSKKEQIELLNKRVDSLNHVLNSLNFQINQKNSIISEFQTRIIDLNKVIEIQEIQLSKLEKDLREKELTLKKKNEEFVLLSKKINGILDSLKEIEAYQKLDTITWKLNNLTWDQREFDLKLELPSSKFYNPDGSSLISRDGKTQIYLFYNYTYAFDEDKALSFYSKQDAINYFSSGLRNLEIEGDNDEFIIKAINNKNEFIFIKGIYSELASMQGREEGEPTWLWSNTLVLKVIVTERDINEYNYMSNILNHSFNVNSIFYKDF